MYSKWRRGPTQRVGTTDGRRRVIVRSYSYVCLTRGFGILVLICPKISSARGGRTILPESRKRDWSMERFILLVWSYLNHVA